MKNILTLSLCLESVCFVYLWL